MASSSSRRVLFRLLSTSTQPAPAKLPQSITNSLSSIADPFTLLADELSHLKQNIRALLGSEHSTLNSIAKYYFASPNQGKHLRPLVILLIAQASATAQHDHHQDFDKINQPISRHDVLNDSNPNQPTSTEPVDQTTKILPTQRRLAEIAELIHVSSLLHDDVIDQAETRRGQISAPREFGSKLSVLAGDFLLARASLALSRLGNFEVIELISSIISNLVEGELIQLESILNLPSSSTGDSSSTQQSITKFDDRLFEFYQRKNYLKTASLIAKTCRASVLLSNTTSNSHLVEASYEFGKHLGLAFQIVDDILDYTISDQSLGKAANGSDLKSGLITGPGLFAWKEFGHEFGDLVHRKFINPGDLDLAQLMVKKSDGIRKSFHLAKSHIQSSKSHLNAFEDSESKQALYSLCDLVLERSN
ncbi:hypothetical protein Pst134EB_001519 [Puccinia striiformis f. sp. tritici]|nr:hypothetical protein Pst134EB_001519 [Puccinia striiformis f. sp. tritici]